MKIVRSKEMEQQVLRKVKTWLAKRPRSSDAWHVSDLLYPRKAYWQKVDPKPISDDQAGYFIAGIGHHNVVEAILGPQNNKDHRADAGEFKKLGVYYSPDIRIGYPIEFKTSRAPYAPGEGDSRQSLEKGYEGYLKQLKKYMALDEIARGGLLVFYLNLKEGSRSKPRFRFYKVTASEAELAKERKYIKKISAQLDDAVKQKKWQHLELCPDWMCRDCPWKQKCKPKKG